MKDDWGDSPKEDQEGFLVLLGVLAHVGCDPWCSRGWRRAPVTTIFVGKPLVQGKLGAQHGYELSCTHFMLVRCVHQWDIVRVTGPEVLEGPASLGISRRPRPRPR